MPKPETPTPNTPSSPAESAVLDLPGSLAEIFLPRTGPVSYGQAIDVVTPVATLDTRPCVLSVVFDEVPGESFAVVEYATDNYTFTHVGTGYRIGESSLEPIGALDSARNRMAQVGAEKIVKGIVKGRANVATMKRHEEVSTDAS